jgi:hypothetical protein
MLEGIRGNLMRRYQRNRDAIRAMEGNVGPKIKEKLEMRPAIVHQYLLVMVYLRLIA